MKLTFFKRVGEKIRHPFRKENTETVVVSEAVPQPEVDNAAEITINEPSVAMSADKCAEQARYFLLKDNKLVGKPLSSYHPEIRIIHVDSFVNAFVFLAYVRSAFADLSPDRRALALHCCFSGRKREFVFY